MWQSSRPASFSPAGLTLWPSQLEHWLATLSGLLNQVRIPMGCWCRGVTIKYIVVPSWLTLMTYLQGSPFWCRLFFHAKPGTGFHLKWLSSQTNLSWLLYTWFQCRAAHSRSGSTVISDSVWLSILPSILCWTILPIYSLVIRMHSNTHTFIFWRHW